MSQPDAFLPTCNRILRRRAEADRAMRTSTLHISLGALLLAGCSSSTGPGSDTSVLGAFETLDADGNAVGWTLAPSFATHPLEAAVFADGDGETGTLLWTVRANKTRDD